MIFDFKHADLDVKSGSEWFKPLEWEMNDLYQILEDSQNAIQSVGWGAPFIENHDQPRASSKYLKQYARHPEAVKAMGLMYFFLRGTSFIYQGQEIGMINFERQSIDEFNDISSIDQYYRGMEEGLNQEEALAVINKRSRDNSRTPVQWNAEKYVGFSDVKPWLNISNCDKELTISYQEKDENSVLHFYKKMIQFAKGDYSYILNFGEITFLKREVKDVFLYRRIIDGKSVLFTVNLSADAKVISLENQKLKHLFGNNTDWTINRNRMALEPFAAHAWEEL